MNEDKHIPSICPPNKSNPAKTYNAVSTDNSVGIVKSISPDTGIITFNLKVNSAFILNTKDGAIKFTGNGTSLDQLAAELVLSTADGQALQLLPDGYYAPTGGGTGDISTADNSGDGIGIFRDKESNSLIFKSLKPGANIVLTENLTDGTITITSAGGGSGEINTASNIGTGAQVFKTKNVLDFQFRKIKSADDSISVTENTNDISLSTGMTSYANLAALAANTLNYADNTVISSRGFYAANDGGASTYVISSTPFAGYTTDGLMQILLTSGKYALISHNGTLKLNQFGAKGDGVTNDLASFRAALKFSNYDKTLAVLYGKASANYYMTKRTVDTDSINADANYLHFIPASSGVTWDGRGAKITVDNNASQDLVNYTVAGHLNTYRCKQSHLGANAGDKVPNDVLYWQNYYWQKVASDVTPGSHPTWTVGTQYYGANNFIVIGDPTAYTGYDFNPPENLITKNITFVNWEWNGNETDAIALNDGMWNINAKTVCNLEALRNINFDNINIHHFCSEVIYGAGNAYVKGVNVRDCVIHHSHNAISHGGQMTVEDNTFYNCPANAIESFSAIGDKQTYRNNIIHDTHNGITVGSGGNQVDVLSNVLIDNNRIFNCVSNGIYIAGQIRGCVVSNNILYDNANANLSMYALSVGLESTNTEVIISNNIFGVYRISHSMISINSAFGLPGDGHKTDNLIIDNNFFGRLNLAGITSAQYNPGGPFTSTFNSCIDFTGDDYGRNIWITNNKIGDGLNQPPMCNYIVNTTGWLPNFKGNIFPVNAPYQVISQTANPSSTNPVQIYWGNIGSERPTIGVTGGNEVAMFISAPPFSNFPIESVFSGISLGPVDNGRMVVILPTNSNLKRSVFSYSAAGNYFIGDLDYFRNSSGSIQRFWKWNLNPNIVPVLHEYTFTAALSGTVAAGANVSFATNDVGIFIYPASTVHTYSVDKRVINNIAIDTATFTISIIAGTATGLTIQIHNNSGVTQNLASKNVTIRLYSFGNITILPNAIQPLRSEGTTVLRPIGEDVPNYHAFYDADTNENLLWDKPNSKWILFSAIASGGFIYPYDDFNTADVTSAVGRLSPFGAYPLVTLPYSGATGSIGIAGNALKMTVNGLQLIGYNTLSRDVFIQVVLKAVSTGGSLILSYINNINFILINLQTGAVLQLLAGAATTPFAGSGSSIAGDMMSAKLFGTSLSVYRNGVLLNTCTVDNVNLISKDHGVTFNGDTTTSVESLLLARVDGIGTDKISPYIMNIIEAEKDFAITIPAGTFIKGWKLFSDTALTITVGFTNLAADLDSGTTIVANKTTIPLGVSYYADTNTILYFNGISGFGAKLNVNFF